MRLLLVRHAQTVWNAAGRVQGQADPPLSEKGHEQCQAIGARLAGVRLDAIYSSDLERARLTADAIGRATGTGVTLEPGLREVGLGRWEGFDRETLLREYPELYEAWVKQPTWELVPEGEGTAAFRARVLETLGRLLAAHGPSATLAVVTHIGVIRLVLSIAAGVESAVLRWPWAIDNTAITTLTCPADLGALATPAVTINAVNDASHLQNLARRG